MKIKRLALALSIIAIGIEPGQAFANSMTYDWKTDTVYKNYDNLYSIEETDEQLKLRLERQAANKSVSEILSQFSFQLKGSSGAGSGSGGSGGSGGGYDTSWGGNGEVFQVPSGYWTEAYHNFPESVSKTKSSMVSRVKDTIENMKKYDYKKHVLKYSSITVNVGSASQHTVHYDPYMILALICVESNGNPNANKDKSSRYKGLMQTDKDSYSSGQNMYDPETNIRVGVSMIHSKHHHFNDSKNIALAIYGFNSGQGTVENALKTVGYNKKSPELENMRGGQMGIVIGDYVRVNNPTWSSQEKREYFGKVLYAYNMLRELKALE